MASSSTGETLNLGVVVGFDGSPHAQHALRWAARAATRRNMPLTVASAYLFPYSDYLHSVAPGPDDDVSQRIADGMLAEAKQLLKDDGHQGEVDYLAIIGDATAGLVSVSADAELLVVGRRGLGRFWGRVLGSVAAALPAYAHCPTVVVHSPDEVERKAGDLSERPDTARDTRDICVGVDSSAHARHAALTAAQEAKRLGVGLEVVHAQPPFTGTSSVWYLQQHEDLEQQTTQNTLEFLAEEIEFLQEQVPGVDMKPTAMRGAPAEVMIECSERSQLTVLGTRGRGGFTSLLLGSVSCTTLAHARGAIMVVPLPDDHPRKTQ
ncbi:universal stress protein [Yaniella halotolerans]|uniref:universal stress protein n=1 Tax=Yaniella halotolerans TaxID=225453 RepID=UPI0003B32117|nr:universal stress protein [Yaniella halotolerans]